jgi:hypothetical protein
MYRDGFGNWCSRLVAPAGRFRLFADALINDRGIAEPVVPDARQHPVEELPEETLVYLLGSRYCETELLSEIAWALSALLATMRSTPARSVALMRAGSIEEGTGNSLVKLP